MSGGMRSNDSRDSSKSSGRHSKKSQGYSETSKKSRRANTSAKKPRKKREIKEGAPFEEESLLEVLHDETKITKEDKDQVKNLMAALSYFGLIDEAMDLHSLLERCMKAAHAAVTQYTNTMSSTEQDLSFRWTVTQERVL